MAARQVARAVQQQQPPWRPASTCGLRASDASPVLAMLAVLQPSALGSGLARRGFQTLGSPLLAKKREYAGYARNKRQFAHPDQGMVQTTTNSMSILLPDTMVKPPISNFPRSPVKFMRMAWHYLRHSAKAWMTIAFYKISSKPSFLSRARFQIKRGTLVPTVKALHLELNDALARGSKHELRRICTNEFYATLAGVIDARPRGYRAEWELVKYNRPLTYPRLSGHLIGVVPLQSGQRAIHQAVVSIASTQRVTRYDAAGAVAAEQTKDMVEHLVITCDIDPKTHESTPWKIWGTLPETTLEAYLDTKASEDWFQSN